MNLDLDIYVLESRAVNAWSPWYEGTDSGQKHWYKLGTQILDYGAQ